MHWIVATCPDRCYTPVPGAPEAPHATRVHISYTPENPPLSLRYKLLRHPPIKANDTTLAP